MGRGCGAPNSVQVWVPGSFPNGSTCVSFFFLCSLFCFLSVFFLCSLFCFLSVFFLCSVFCFLFLFAVFCFLYFLFSVHDKWTDAFFFKMITVSTHTWGNVYRYLMSLSSSHVMMHLNSFVTFLKRQRSLLPRIGAQFSLVSPFAWTVLMWLVGSRHFLDKFMGISTCILVILWWMSTNFMWRKLFNIPHL